MQAARCSTQLSHGRVRQPVAPVLSTRQASSICSNIPVQNAFKPASIVSLRAQQRAAVVTRAADIQAAPIDVASTADDAQQAREGVARLRFQRGSVFKVRRILDVLRGRSYEEALSICEYLPYRACETITRVLVSAAANAKHNTGALKAKLVVSEAFADQGPWLKRFRPRAQGRAYKILKGTYHLTIRVTESA
jgi:large subunit ribosomal protein L22